MRRPRVEEALVWVHWHDEGLNMMINMAKGGPAGIVGLHHMAITHSTGEGMRWAAYAFWKAAEANRAVRKGGRSRAAAGGGWPGGAGSRVAGPMAAAGVRGAEATTQSTPAHGAGTGAPFTGCVPVPKPNNTGGPGLLL
jgi:hypothetical protein